MIKGVSPALHSGDTPPQGYKEVGPLPFYLLPSGTIDPDIPAKTCQRLCFTGIFCRLIEFVKYRDHQAGPSIITEHFLPDDIRAAFDGTAQSTGQ